MHFFQCIYLVQFSTCLQHHSAHYQENRIVLIHHLVYITLCRWLPGMPVPLDREMNVSCTVWIWQPAIFMLPALNKLSSEHGLTCDENVKCATSTWLLHTWYAFYVSGMDIIPFCDKYNCQGDYVKKQPTTDTFTVYSHISSIKILPLVCGHCKLLSDPPSYSHWHILANSKKILSTPCSTIKYSQQYTLSPLASMTLWQPWLQL
jgi:hypothetical protein